MKLPSAFCFPRKKNSKATLHAVSPFVHPLEA